MKKITLFILIFITLGQAHGQFWSQFSMSNLNPYREISAFGGLDRQTIFTAQLRSQWDAFQGRPVTQYIGVHTPVYIWNGAVGMDLTSQNQGVVGLTRFRVSYNHVRPMAGGLVSFGARVGYTQARIDGDRIITPEGEYADGSIIHNDILLASGLVNNNLAQYEISGVYMNQNIAIGISISDIVPLKLTPSKGILLKNIGSVFFRNFFSVTQSLDLQSSIAIKSDFINVQSEISSILKINGNIFGGVVLRGFNSSSFDALGFLVGYNVNEKLSMFYTYDAGISKLRSVHQGGHELIVKYRLNKLFGTGLPPKIIYNPRFL